jgi:uncharacterized protein
MDPIKIIQKFYKADSKAFDLLVSHSKAVTKKALEIAKNVKHLNPDLKFIEEASMLHDIGIFLTNAPEIECFGRQPYICHGYLGREILEKEGLPKHALVCERHVGMGISVQDIDKRKIPMPRRDMSPITIEEKIICFADKFFSKKGGLLTKEKTIDEIKKDQSKFGEDKVKIFDGWVKTFLS